MVKMASLGPQLVKKRRVATVAVQLAQVGAAGASPSHGQQLVPSTAIGSVATMLMSGGRFVGGGSGGRMVTLTGSETVASPPLSVALAVKAWLPGASSLRRGSGGRMVTLPGSETVASPPLSVALAVKAWLPGAALVQSNSQ